MKHKATSAQRHYSSPVVLCIFKPVHNPLLYSEAFQKYSEVQRCTGILGVPGMDMMVSDSLGSLSSSHLDLSLFIP